MRKASAHFLRRAAWSQLSKSFRASHERLGERAEHQVGGYDMKARLNAIAREGIDR